MDPTQQDSSVPEVTTGEAPVSEPQQYASAPVMEPVAPVEPAQVIEPQSTDGDTTSFTEPAQEANESPVQPYQVVDQPSANPSSSKVFGAQQPGAQQPVADDTKKSYKKILIIALVIVVLAVAVIAIYLVSSGASII
jgi:hypothetical protein